MSANLITKSEFSRRAGVEPSTITRACKTVLKDAVVGKKLDASHPSAIAYLEEKHTPKGEAPATGIDPLYEAAVTSCGISGRYTATSIQKAHKIGWERAKAILATMQVNGVIPENPTPQDPVDSTPIPPVIDTASKPRGHVAKNQSKKEGKYEEGSFTVPEYIGDLADMTLRELIMQFGTDVRFVDWLKATKEIEMINEKRLKNAESEGTLVSRRLVKVGIIDPLESAHIKLLTDGVKTIARRSVALHDSGRDLSEIEDFVADQISSFLRPVKAKVARALKNV